MRLRHFIIALSLLSPLPACTEVAISDAALASTVESLLSALERKDIASLWNLSDTRTRQLLLSLGESLAQARANVPMVWEPAQHQAAFLSLGSELFATLPEDEVQRGQTLLAALLQLDVLTLDEGTKAGVAPSDLIFENSAQPRALLLTRGGERLSFTKEEDRWASTLVRDQLLDSGLYKSLKESAEKTNAMAVERLRAWNLTQDPKTPQGAYNLARAAEALRPVDYDMLYALLDGPSRQAVVTVLEEARKTQRELQRRTPKSERRNAYRQAGILHLVDQESDRSLFRTWVQESFTPLLEGADAPIAVHGTLESKEVLIESANGKRIKLRLEDDGFWRLADVGARLKAALGPRPEAAITP